MDILEGHGYGGKVIGLRFMMVRVLNPKRPLTCSMFWGGGGGVYASLCVCLFKGGWG